MVHISCVTHDVIIIFLNIFCQADMIFFINYNKDREKQSLFSENFVNYLRVSKKYLVKPVLLCATIAYASFFL